MKRDQKLIACALVGTVLVGLSSRAFADTLPPFVSDHTGDVLWSVAVYLAAALLLPGARPRSLAMATLLVSFAVEFSQLIQTPWLVSLRSNLIARLFLGTTFVWWDFLRYLVGTLIALAFDILVLNRFHRLKRESRV